MTRSEYLGELRARLARLSPEEAQAAIEFYAEYFEDAEDDAAVIETLGSPGRVAAQILAETSAQRLNDSPISPYRLAAAGQQAAPLPKPRGSFPDYMGGAAGASASAAEPQAAEHSGGAAAPTSGGSAEQKARPDTAGQPAPIVPGGYTRESYHGAGNARAVPNPAPVPPPARDCAPAAVPPSPYTTPEGRRSSLSSIWYVILGILALPVALPLALVAIVLIIACGAVCVALVALFFVCILFLIAAGFHSVRVFFTVGGGIEPLGIAFVLLGLALILVPLLVLLAAWLVRAIGKVSAKLFNKLKARSNRHEKQQ